MLGLLILIRDSLLVILMAWAGMDSAPEQKDKKKESSSYSSSSKSIL